MPDAITALPSFGNDVGKRGWDEGDAILQPDLDLGSLLVFLQLQLSDLKALNGYLLCDGVPPAGLAA